MKSFLYLGLLIIIIFMCGPASAQVINGDFNTNVSGWSSSTSGEGGANLYWLLYGDDGRGILKVGHSTDGDHSGYSNAWQHIDVTGYQYLNFSVNTLANSNDPDYGGHIKATLGSQTCWINNTGNTWQSKSINIAGNGVKTIEFEVYRYMTGIYKGTFWLRLDNVELIPYPKYIVSGYVKNNAGTGLNGAIVTLDSLSGNATTNESGYYEITQVLASAYTITTTKPGYQDYSDSITVSGDTTKNITLSYEVPTLTSLSILDSGDNSLLLGWKENLGVDGVYVYVDSQINLVATVETPYTNIKMYDLTNLEPGTSYNMWCKPYKDSLDGSMYYVSGTTTGGGGGGGGGGAVEVLPPYEDIQPEIPEYPDTYDMTNITSSDLITLAATNPEVIYEALSNITIKSPLPDKPGDNLLYFYLLIISVCSTLFSSKKEGWEVVTIISVVVVIISLIKLGWI